MIRDAGQQELDVMDDGHTRLKDLDAGIHVRVIRDVCGAHARAKASSMN